MKSLLRNGMSRKIALGAIVGVAALLFLVSIFSPFLRALLYGCIGSHAHVQGEVWSFKASFTLYCWDWILPNGSYGVTSNVSKEQLWFTDYWVFGKMPENLAIHGWGLFHGAEFAVSISLVVFVEQIATLLFIALSLLIGRLRWPWLLGAAICGLFTVRNMWAFSREVADFHSFESGFWLAVASDVLLFAVFIASLTWNRTKQR